MEKHKTVYDRIDDFDLFSNTRFNIYVNDKLKLKNILVNELITSRNSIDNILIKLTSNTPISYKLIEDLKNYKNLLEIKLEVVNPTYNWYKEILLYDAQCINEKSNIVKGTFESTIKVEKIEYLSNSEEKILKEWYCSHNKIQFYNPIPSVKKYEESITYKYGRRKVFELVSGTESYNFNSFWIVLKDYKFKVSIDETKNEENIYHNYSIEYRKEWGMIPNDDKRHDISIFLSFIIGTEMVKIGETGYGSNNIVKKQYIAPSPLERCSLFQTNFEFYDKKNTASVIKQIPKMLNKYFKLKDEYRLNEVLASLYIHSYLNFNFINYVTYIEMFANICLEKQKKKTVVTKNKFKSILTTLNSIKGIPNEIKEKFNQLNTIGIGKKVKKMLLLNRIDYNKYKDVFKVRGAVVHGKYVDIEKIYAASQKAKELLTILTLKKLNYTDYIRDFINDDEIISLK